MSPEAALAICVGIMLVSAVGTALTRDVVRLVLWLGLFLVSVALAFLALGHPLLSAAQVFVYVGGVLVLVLVALMTVRRGAGDRPVLSTKHDVAAAAIAVSVFVILALVGPSPEPTHAEALSAPARTAQSLLGSGLVAFELAGVVLLAALLAVLVVVKGVREP